MAVAAVADEVDEHVLVEALAELGRDAAGLHDGLRVVSVGVQRWRRDQLGELGRVAREAVVLRRGREADLVVDDHVDRAAGAEPGQLRQAQRLHHEALPHERGVAVHQQRQHERAARVGQVVLLARDDALRDRVDRLEVARVEQQRKVDVGARGRAVVARVAEVVLHVAVALDVVGEEVPLELGQDHLVGLAEDVGEHVEAAAVRHAHHDLARAQPSAFLDDLVQQRHEGLAALEREALGAHVLLVQELLEHVRAQELLEDLDALGGRQVRAVARGLDPVLDPLALFLVLDVHVLDGDVAAVRGAQVVDQLADPRDRLRLERGDLDRAREVRLAQTELREFEQGMGGLVVPERVEARDEVPRFAVGVDQVEDPDRRRDAGPAPRRLAGVLEALAARGGRRRPGGGRRGGRGGGAVPGELEPREEDPPVVGNRGRVGEIPAIEFVYVVGVRDVREIGLDHDLRSRRRGAVGILCCRSTAMVPGSGAPSGDREQKTARPRGKGGGTRRRFVRAVRRGRVILSVIRARLRAVAVLPEGKLRGIPSPAASLAGPRPFAN